MDVHNLFWSEMVIILNRSLSYIFFFIYFFKKSEKPVKQMQVEKTWVAMICARKFYFS